MEALVFGLIALSTIHKKQELIVPEPDEFQAFDLRALDRPFNTRDSFPGRLSDRKESYVEQTVS